MSRQIGKVKWFHDDKGYGFIEHAEDRSQIFVHFSAILQEGFRKLHRNQPVEYEILLGPKGKYAERVVVLEKDLKSL